MGNSIFNDLMNLTHMVERVVKGEVEDVKREIVEDFQRDRAQAADPSPAPAEPCDRAPPGYKCLGEHDDRGHCMTLELLESPTP